MSARRIGVNKLVLGRLVRALLGSGLLVWNPFEMANVLAVATIGLAIVPIFPAMMSGTESGWAIIMLPIRSACK